MAAASGADAVATTLPLITENGRVRVSRCAQAASTPRRSESVVAEQVRGLCRSGECNVCGPCTADAAGESFFDTFACKLAQMRGGAKAGTRATTTLATWNLSVARPATVTCQRQVSTFGPLAVVVRWFTMIHFGITIIKGCGACQVLLVCSMYRLVYFHTLCSRSFGASLDSHNCLRSRGPPVRSASATLLPGDRAVRRTRLHCHVGKHLSLLATRLRTLTRFFSNASMCRCVSSTPAVRMRPVAFPRSYYPERSLTGEHPGAMFGKTIRVRSTKFCASNVRRRRCTIGQQGRFSTASKPLTMARIEHDQYAWWVRSLRSPGTTPV